LFSLFASAAVGAVVGVLQIALLHRDRARPIPFGPYLALAAAMWVFAGDRLLAWWRTW